MENKVNENKVLSYCEILRYIIWWYYHFGPDLFILRCIQYHKCTCVKDFRILLDDAGAETRIISWWRHEMETLSALLALCVGNPPAPEPVDQTIETPVIWDAFAFIMTSWNAGKNRSLPLLLMPWWCKEPRYQQPWYWLCNITVSLSAMGKDFNFCAILELQKNIM